MNHLLFLVYNFCYLLLYFGDVFIPEQAMLRFTWQGYLLGSDSKMLLCQAGLCVEARKSYTWSAELALCFLSKFTIKHILF
jgi:hypothetical protein